MLWRFRSLRTKMLLFILLPVVAVLLSVVLWQNLNNRNRAYEQAQALMEATAKEYANSADALLEVAMDSARTLAQALSAFDAIPAEHRRDVFRGMLRRMLEENPNFLGTWACFEPNALDGRDAEFQGKEGHDTTGRFIPYFYREGGTIHEEPLRDYDTPGAGDYYLLARNSGREVLLEPYEYEIAGKKMLMTTCSVPIKREGRVVGVAGVDILLETLQKQFSGVKVLDTGFLRIVSARGMVVTHPQEDRIGKPWGEVQDNSAPEILERMKKGEVYTAVTYSEVLRKFTFKSFVPFLVGNTTDPWMASIVVPQEEVFAQANRDFMRALLIVIAAAVGLAILIFFVSGMFSRPLQRLAQAAQEVARGNLRVEVQEVQSRDEIEALSRAFATMVGNLREVTTQITNTSSSLAASSEELSSSIGEISRATQEIAKTVAQVAEGSGVQSQELERIRQEAESIAQKVAAIEKATEHNLGILQEMVENVGESIRALEEIEKAMQKTVEEGKASYGEAQRGQDLLKVLSGNIHAIAEVARDVSQAIETLESRSQEIGKIVEVITGIAEQTNLLALNAAIEAARAGEAGRGFAVVAEEVRKLAENSAQAAGQIAHLITQIRQDTKNAVESMGRATKRVEEGVTQGEQVTQSFIRILKAVETSITSLGNLASIFERSRTIQETLRKRSDEVQTLSEDNARGVREVAQAVSNITERMNTVAAVSEENAASSQEVSASTEEQSASLEELSSAAESLARVAEELRKLVDRFTL
ncbi:MAG: methyl-accepting chemotaxis protein [Candidatus Caldatribacteriaceae bacterium]